MTAHATAAPPSRNYVRIWAILCGLLAVSIIGPMFGVRVVTLVTAFGVAIVKAFLVAKHFMHLDIEKRWAAYILLAMLAFMFVMFGGMAPDVVRHTGLRWEKTYVEPATGATGGHGPGQ